MNDQNITGIPAGTPESKLPASPAAAREDIEKLQAAVLELRDKLLQLREKELFELREKVSGFQQQIKQVVIVGAVLGAAGAFLGIKQFSDIQASIDTSFKRRIEASFVFYDELARVQVLARDNACASALPVIRELTEQRPDEEVLNYLALHCFDQTEQYEPGYQFLSRLRQRGFFSGRARLATTFNNAGWLVCVKAFVDPSFEGEAVELLRRAEQLYASEGSRDIALPMYGMAMLFVSKGDLGMAEEYAKRFRETVTSGEVTYVPDWRDGIDRFWFKAIEGRRPNVRRELEQLFPKGIGFK